ncbi:Hpt domain-containing protein [Sphingomonas sp. ID1715]|uniref:Hpt domain-containing protein n=1 Tax=Sphingomonas sp. ID1715 TaxID=1656898 RepID=UPI00148800DD|nr:Hpt domain-containing protein [Sphingomonas sp. ID1715]NNM75426.1 Hpt domain-containing protein [Sphingomonas sp. ID1715]
MSFEQALNTTLAAAFGDDQSLVLELRGAFIESAERHCRAMAEAASDDEWRDAALRLKGLAASFGATSLMEQAGRAAASARNSRLLVELQGSVAAVAL